MQKPKIQQGKLPTELHTTKRRPPSPEQIRAQQKADAEKDSAAVVAKLPAKVPSAAVAVPDGRTQVQRYLDEIAPAGIVGRLIKFSKEGVFATNDDGEPVPEAADFIALCDQTLVGWIKYNRDKDSDAPPERVMGLLYDGFVVPARETLGDTDQTKWEPGLSGAPEDPWHHQVCLVLQNTETRELYTFATTSQTGRRAVGNLLKHYDRMRRTNADELPVVRLKAGGFNHRDDRIGWVSVPVFAVHGRAPRDSAAKPDTSLAADMSDEIPF
jgi:hypothetical protein